MTHNISSIERNVMAGVRMVRLGRTLVSRTALEVYTLVASVYVLGRLVWVSRVVDNFFAVERLGVGATGRYLLYALEHTHLGVQAALAVATVAGALFVADLLRTVVTPRQFA
jgi:hypothetical protein